MSAHSFSNQPVWDEIAQAAPDVLVLLGDSIYLDAGGPYSSSGIQDLSAGEFARYAHGRYRLQANQAAFKALVQRPSLSTYAIWDDHDFLWNNACGADVQANPNWRDLAYPSRALFAAWRTALAQKFAPGSFPAAPPPWSSATPAPGYTVQDLGGGVYLHLTDGRSFKKAHGKDAILGAAQMAALTSQLQQAPAGAVHLLASGVVFEARHGESWLACKTEHTQLLQLATQYKLLVLSGDIHDNNLATYETAPASGRFLHEATASGAAVRTAVTVGALQRNWGLLEINSAKLSIRLSKSGAANYQGAIDRTSWKGM